MHGRLKVKSPEHIEKERALAKQKKLEGYKNAMATIFSLRGQEPSPERDLTLLKITEGVLLNNPAISTLWNIRRQILIQRIDKSGGNSSDEAEVLLSKEKEVTHHCLINDPKSYGAWHHRGWTISRCTAQLDRWTNEIQLTSKFLQMDERNFHCWDYRRFALSQLGPAGANDDEELKFSTEAIHVNFSNYSAWHYRSKLLPRVHPSAASPIGISEQIRRDELDLVQVASGIGGQSLHQTKSMGCQEFHRRGRQEMSRHSYIKGYQRIMQICATFGGYQVSKWPRCSSTGNQFRIHSSGKFLIEVESMLDLGHSLQTQPNLDLRSASGNPSDSLWLACLTGSSAESSTKEIEVRLIVGGSVVDEVRVEDGDYVSQEVTSPQATLDDATRQLLVEEMDNCRQLLELEPDSKWTMLTLALIAQAVDSETHREEILDLYERLQIVDSMRKRYYEDQKSKFVIRQELAKFFSNEHSHTLDIRCDH